MPCHIITFGTLWGTWNQPMVNPGTCFLFQVEIVLNISTQHIQCPSLLITWNIGQVSLLVAQMTGTIVAPARSWCCASHHKSPIVIMLYIRPFSTFDRCTSSESRCVWNGRCANRILSIWKYPTSKIYERFVTDLQSTCYHQAQNRVTTGTFTGHLQIGMIWF